MNSRAVAGGFANAAVGGVSLRALYGGGYPSGTVCGGARGGAGVVGALCDCPRRLAACGGDGWGCSGAIWRELHGTGGFIHSGSGVARRGVDVGKIPGGITERHANHRGKKSRAYSEGE